MYRGVDAVLEVGRIALVPNVSTLRVRFVASHNRLSDFFIRPQQNRQFSRGRLGARYWPQQVQLVIVGPRQA